jgi:hypothetical protein
MARKERRFDIQKTSYASAPCSAAARAVAQLGFASNSFGTVLAALPLIGAAGFVAVLSEPLSHRLLSFVILGIIPALAVRASGWVLFWALRSASCSCHVPNLRLPGCHYGAHTGNRRRSLEEGKPRIGCSGRRRGEQLTKKGPAEMRGQVLPLAIRKGRGPSEEASPVRDIALDTTFPKRQNGRVRPLQAQRLPLAAAKQ